MTKTSVTYVMPVLNEESYLRQAVESIFEQSFEGSVDLVLALGHQDPGFVFILFVEGAAKRLSPLGRFHRDRNFWRVGFYCRGVG